MARLESVAIGGYYATPPHLVPLIAALFERAKLERSVWEYSNLTIVDPCAGDGEAVLALTSGLTLDGDKHDHHIHIHVCELEATRALALQENLRKRSYSYGQRVLMGDAFRATFRHGGAGILYLNPPYDTDRVHGRLEQRFLDRFAPALRDGGALLFVVPYYALKASAATLAKDFENLRCWRFPGADFDGYKQVVLYATRREASLYEPHAGTLAMVHGWASDASSLPELGSESPALPVPVFAREPDFEWTLRPLDLAGLVRKIRPWSQTLRNGQPTETPGIIPDLPVQDLLLRQYPLATPPRPAHIAAGIASGLFNGAKLTPDNKRSKLPALLVKGVFDREYKTIEQKLDKDGNVKGLVQIQQPKLVTTVLDLSSHKYHILASSAEPSGATDVASMNVADLLAHYSESLMAVMAKQCPVLYDPRRDAASIPLAESPRRMFNAQAHAARALVKLLGGPVAKSRQGKAAILLGEIGSGKSTVALMTGQTIGAKSTLVLCPPHLLQSWKNEVAAVVPNASVHVLSSVEDLDNVDFARRVARELETGLPVVSILSRETAKLSHGWEDAGPLCSKCGQMTPGVDLAKKRLTCEVAPLLAKDELARFTVDFARWLMPHAPTDENIPNVLRSRFDRRRLALCAGRAHYLKKGERGFAEWRGVPKGYFGRAALGLIERMFSRDAAKGWKNNQEDRAKLDRALLRVVLAANDSDFTVAVCRLLFGCGEKDYSGSVVGQAMLLTLPVGHPAQDELRAEQDPYNGAYPWKTFRENVAKIATENVSALEKPMSWATGKLVYDGVVAGSVQAAQIAFRAVAERARFAFGEVCGEPLYGASPSPRRVALAQHVTRYHAKLFDFLVLDEGHEYANENAAQAISAHRLTSLGMPVLLMTGSFMNGYAESVFSNMWSLSPDFRREFARDDKTTFVDRYGYRKRLLEDKKAGEVIEFGSQSDRVLRSEKVIGNAPGILPLFLLKHLLPIAVTLHKADLAIDLPVCRQHRHLIEPSAELRANYERLKAALVTQIKCDMFKENAGKLWGQLSELPSYLDRATDDVGNNKSGSYEIRYPESAGGELVAGAEGFARSELQAKEAWMLAQVERDIEAGRNVMVFSWHVALLPRLARLIAERTGLVIPILHADKVPTAKRQDWIDREVVKKGARVLVVNPVTIQTGLNNLVHFASEVWMENPACNPVVYRQAIGRIDRIGQKKTTDVHFPVYARTLQEALYDLLMKKVAVSVSTDGLDPESALQAAGVGQDEYLAGLSIGKQLWSMSGFGDDEDEDTNVVSIAMARRKKAVNA